MKSILEGRPGLAREINKVAEVAGYLWQKGWAERNEKVIARLDKMFDNGWYWHGNEPCHQIAYLYDAAGAPEKKQERVHHILRVHWEDVALIFFTVLAVGFLSVWYPVRYLSRRLLSK